MPAYVVALIHAITEPEAYKRYVAQVEATLGPFGGRFLARKPDPTLLEGGPAPSRSVILAFPDEERARAWHASPAYEPVMKLRQSASKGTLLLLPSYPEGAARAALHDVCYVEMVSADVDAARRLCEKAYGWRFGEPDEALGGAYVATLPSGARFAIRTPMHEMETPLVRTYVRVADVDAAVRDAEALGAEVVLPPVALPENGRIAIFVVGEVEQGVWQLP